MVIEGNLEDAGLYLVRTIKDGTLQIAQLHIHNFQSPSSSILSREWTFMYTDQEFSFEAAKTYIEPICRLDLNRLADLVKLMGTVEFPAPELSRLVEEKYGDGRS